jgi:hypothetical protein
VPSHRADRRADRGGRQEKVNWWKRGIILGVVIALVVAAVIADAMVPIFEVRHAYHAALTNRMPLPQILEPGSHPAWRTHVAYQWDGVTDKGDFYKGGFGDQLLYVAPRKSVVIAYFGTNQTLDSKPRRPWT